MEKNKNYISWEKYFMSLVELNAMRSKDPNTQVGALIVNNLNQIIASGYNGLPRGLDDNNYNWGREGEWINTKYPYVAHAELNAILNALNNVKNCSIYVSLFPCNECSKAIIQSGISKIYFGEDKYKGTDENNASKRMLDDAKVPYEYIKPVKIKIID